MSGELQLSVLIPCLNEAGTLERAILEAMAGLEAAQLKGEVIVADNGSTDGSQDIARNAGARLVPVALRGYGSALHHGIIASRATHVLFADADLSYDFTLIPRFAPFLADPKADLVLGTRLGGEVLPGAMPFLNRYLGTPVLNRIIWLFFGLGTTDCNSGMRLLRKEFYRRLAVRSPGMEWASELLIKTAIRKGGYFEVPIHLRKDQRNRPPHLRRWRDGWRHLKTIVLLSPNRLILLPSTLFLAGALWVKTVDSSPRDAAFILGLLGMIGICLGLLVKLVLHADGVRESRMIGRLLRWPFTELALGLGVISVLAGVVVASVASDSSSWLRLVPYGANSVFFAFAWGVIVTHTVNRLEDPE